MSKKVFRCGGSFSSRPAVTAAEMVAHDLDGSDYGSGALETAARQADNVSCAVGRLVETLFEKGVLTKNEVYQISKGYVPREEVEE